VTLHKVTDQQIASLHPKIRREVANIINEINNMQDEFIFGFLYFVVFKGKSLK